MRRVLCLKSEASFLYVRRHGSVFSGKLVKLHVLPAATFKLGVSVSKKVGNAVVRNKIKRRIKEIFVANFDDIRQKRHFVVTAKEGIFDAKYADLEAEIVTLLKKSGAVARQQ